MWTTARSRQVRGWALRVNVVVGVRVGEPQKDAHPGVSAQEGQLYFKAGIRPG